jgi:hypothetical protein
MLYRVRDRVFHPTTGGRRATELFYTHSPDMVLAAIANPALIDVAQAGLNAWTPHLEALATGHGSEVTITAEHIRGLDAFLAPSARWRAPCSARRSTASVRSSTWLPGLVSRPPRRSSGSTS